MITEKAFGNVKKLLQKHSQSHLPAFWEELDAAQRQNLLGQIWELDFAEIDDCSYWKNGRDRDNKVLYIINGIKQGDFEIGNPSEQHIDLYKTNNLCLILINRQHPANGFVNINYEEKDNNKWRII